MNFIVKNNITNDLREFDSPRDVAIFMLGRDTVNYEIYKTELVIINTADIMKIEKKLLVSESA